MYVIRPLFEKFQRELVAYANTQHGHDFLSQFGGSELKENYPIVKVAPDGIHQFIGLDQKGNGIYRAVFYPRSPYVKHLAEVLTMMDIAFENNKRVEDRKLLPFVIPHFNQDTFKLNSMLPRVYLATGTFNPDANPESTSVDGHGGTIQSARTWAQIISDAGNTANDSATRLDLFFLSSGTTDRWDRSHRGIFLFDTSSLANDAIKQSATFGLYEPNDGAFANNFGGAVCLVESTPASNTAVANGDYNQVGSTQQATDVNMSTIGANLNAYNDWTLNATGLTNISLTGVTKFGLKFSFDRAASSPTWSGSKRNQLYPYGGDNASNKPRLVVTYIIPSPGNPMFMSNGGLSMG